MKTEDNLDTQETQNVGSVTKFINKYFIWIMLVVNPVNVGVLFHLYFSENIDESKLFLGVYTLMWAFLVVYRIIYPLTMKSYNEFKKKTLETRVEEEDPTKAMDALIDKTWKEYEEEKKRSGK